ncbi:MAG: hypothetical protein LBQ83_06600 [Candidatus Margulisbacteria bacterium]|jgi:hypothetical protein|nr:hypothetical protein [Candidatus Margulisiibacteriota bacterium]
MQRKFIAADEQIRITGKFPRDIREFLQANLQGKVVFNRQRHILRLSSGLAAKDLDLLLESVQHKSESEKAYMRIVAENYKRKHGTAEEHLLNSRIFLAQIAGSLQEFVDEPKNPAKKNAQADAERLREIAGRLNSADPEQVKDGLRRLRRIIPAKKYDFTRNISALLQLRRVWPDLAVHGIVDSTLTRYYKRQLREIIARLDGIQTASSAVKKAFQKSGQAFRQGLQLLSAEAADGPEEEGQGLIESPAAFVAYCQRLLEFFSAAEYAYVLEYQPEVEEQLTKLKALLARVLQDNETLVTRPGILSARTITPRAGRFIPLLRLIARLQGRAALRVDAADSLHLRLLVNDRPLPFFYRWLAGLSRRAYNDILINLKKDFLADTVTLQPYAFAVPDGVYRTFVLSVPSDNSIP